jgi:transposase
VKVFGALGRGVLHVMQAGSTRSEVFRVFLEALRQKYGRVAFVADNAASHKSQLIQKYLKSTSGDVVLMYLPTFPPQPNPIKIQWRMIKARLAGRYFATEDEMECSIIQLV